MKSYDTFYGWCFVFVPIHVHVFYVSQCCDSLLVYLFVLFVFCLSVGTGTKALLHAMPSCCPVCDYLLNFGVNCYCLDYICGLPLFIHYHVYSTFQSICSDLLQDNLLTNNLNELWLMLTFDHCFYPMRKVSYLDYRHSRFEATRELVQYLPKKLLVSQRLAHLHYSYNSSL